MSSETSGHKLHGIRVSSAESEEDQRITRDVTQLPFDTTEVQPIERARDHLMSFPNIFLSVLRQEG